MSAQTIYEILFATFAFFLGACVGSFLNVCIYRLPLDMSVNEPKRSFCPICKYQIPWTSNLPLITWTVQRGKCRNCKAPIPFRYFGVELLTAVLFLAVWWRLAYHAGPIFPGHWVLVFPMFTFVSLLVVATFIDFEHYIIPDGVTIGGTFAGIVFSAGLPLMHGETMFGIQECIRSLMWSVIGAAFGFALLWLVSWLGKLAFGRKSLPFDKPTAFTWTVESERGKLSADGKDYWWDELFSSEKDTLVMQCERFEIEGRSSGGCEIRSLYEKLTFDGQDYDLNTIKTFSGTMTRLDFRRTAMGFGDVKFIACIGAFLGWQAVLFTVMAASVAGALVGGVPKLIGKKDWSPKIPFGPYLALGAMIWFFCGREILEWYFNQFAVPMEF